MEIKRSRYLKRLMDRKDNGIIKIITGIRRCGKSYLLFHLFKNYLLNQGISESHVIEPALDGIENVGANLKYYFMDVGLRNARLNFRQKEPTHLMENIVYLELLSRGYNVDVGVVDAFETSEEGRRVHKQLEVDFIVNKGSTRYYIQVAYDFSSEEKRKQELNSLKNISDFFKKIVIVNGTKKPYQNEEGFVIMGMKNFLMDDESLDV